MPPHPNLLKLWGLTPAELSQIVGENPSMRGLIFGFVAEYKLKAAWLGRPGISNLFRPRSHDRKKKGDFQFSYRGRSVTIEVKCLDAPKVRRDGATWTGTFQCNASDTTRVVLPDGSAWSPTAFP